MKAVRLKTEYLQDPLGIDIPHPRLFWTCEDGITQSASFNSSVPSVNDDSFTYGKIGCKVWIYKGEVLNSTLRQTAPEAPRRERRNNDRRRDDRRGGDRRGSGRPYGDRRRDDRREGGNR